MLDLHMNFNIRNRLEINKTEDLTAYQRPGYII